MSGISVVGGSGSITARCTEMLSLSSTIRSAADEVEATVHALRHHIQAVASGPELHQDLNLLAYGETINALDAAATATGHGLEAAARLREQAERLKSAAILYEYTERHTSTSLWDSIIDLPLASLKALIAFEVTLSPTKAFETFITNDPALAEELGAAADPVLDHFAHDYPDGHPVVVDEGTALDPGVDATPRDLEELFEQLSARNEGPAGEISVGISGGLDGGPRNVIVDVPGTKSWTPLHTGNVTSLSTNVRSIAGDSTAYEQGVLEALTEAGVRPSDNVMIVGHSEGGMVAITAARDAVNSGRFNVTHVVTLGSPIAEDLESLPRSVQVLAVENKADIVPRLDGKPNPDRINVTTVTGDINHDAISANHSIDDSYEPIAEKVQSSQNTSIRSFLTSARGYFGGADQFVERYDITRRY